MYIYVVFYRSCGNVISKMLTSHTMENIMRYIADDLVLYPHYELECLREINEDDNVMDFENINVDKFYSHECC